MKRLKLITKFFFQQKCSEIWGFIKGFIFCVLGVAIVIAISFILSLSIGYPLVKFMHITVKDGDPILLQYIGTGGVGVFIIMMVVVAVCLILSFISWINENIDLAKDRANVELGLTSVTATFNKEVDKQISKNKIARKMR